MAGRTFTTTLCAEDKGGATAISAVHPDILLTQILTRLDGPTLASASCASHLLLALSSEYNLWRDLCRATWPSIDHPRVQHLISDFPSRHRSLFSDSFPILHPHDPSSEMNLHRPSDPPSELISAVDIYYKNDLLYSKVVESETRSGWFRHSPFRVDLLEHKEAVPMPVKYEFGDDTWQRQLADELTLSWIVIDPTRKRSANLSSRRPVRVRRHWLDGDVQARFAVVLPGKRPEMVECKVVVTCGGEEGGEVHVREVSMQVEDMEGRNLNGEESLVILREAIGSGRRKVAGKKGEERERYEQYVEMKRERRERKQRREKRMDMVCMGLGFSVFAAFLWLCVAQMNTRGV